MALELKTQINIPYIDSDDAFDIFQTVVENGQTRLALEVLVDILATVLTKVDELDDTVAQIVEFLSDDTEETQQIDTNTENIVEEKVKEEKKTTEKKTTKQQVEEIQKEKE